MQDRRRELYRLLAEKASFEVVKETASASQLRVIGRIGKDKWSYWLPVMERLLRASAETGRAFSCDISKQYLAAPDGVRYAWRLIFQSSALEAAMDRLIEVVRSAPRPERVELTEVRLPGYAGRAFRGGVSPRGKGATGVFEAETGALRAARIARGGQ
jgi:hypothetical protein